MKNLLILVLSLFTVNAFAQDNIILKSGEEVQAKVMEITESSIKYKRYDHLNGPLISLKKEEIFMVKYENGRKELFSNTVTPTSSNTSTTQFNPNTSNNSNRISNQTTFTKPEKNSTTTYTRQSNTRTNYYEEHEYNILGGLHMSLDHELIQPGFYMGIEGTRYFSESFGVVGHISAAFNTIESNYYYDESAEMMNTSFLVGIQGRGRDGILDPYGMVTVGSKWIIFSDDSGEIWTPAFGVGGGLIINNQIDVGLRFSYDVDNEVSFLQLGAGYRF